MYTDQVEKPPERDHKGRYLDAEGVPHERVSDFISRWEGAATFLTQWQQRHIVRGAGMRPDIAMIAAALDIKEDREELNRMAVRLGEVSGADIAANLGTAVHAAHEHSPSGVEWAEMYETAISTCLESLGITVVENEKKVFHSLGYAGTIDDVCRKGDGDLFVGDLKNGKQIGRRHIISQLSMYAHALRETVSDSVDTRYGLLVHMPVAEAGELRKSTQIVAKRVELVQDIVRLPWMTADDFKQYQIKQIYKAKVENK